MGKAQSKRSVDITTETTKKGPDGGDEVTGKLEKIEDIDAKQVNGDATPQEKSDAAGEKKDAPDETENEKDLTTEKAAAESTATPSPTDGGGDQTTASATESSPKEDAANADATTPAKAQEGGEEITPLADESLNKKAKKDKPKKKWSFRSISFGKKDKQKPVKNEGSENVAENAEATTNGETTETNKPAEEEAAAEKTATKNEADEAKPDEKPEEKIENGVATEKEQQQMNGQKTPATTPTDDAESKKPIETSTIVANTETATTVATNDVTTSSTPASASVPVPIPSPSQAAPSSTETVKDSHVEKIEVAVSNGTADAEKNGDVHAEEEENKIAAQTEDIKSVIPPPVDEKPHQNGTNGDQGIEEITAATKTLQIEVKTEHEFDNLKSTTTTTSISNTITTNTIIPDDIFNSEQKTTNDNLFITSSQTDINISTNKNNIENINTNTSDKSLTSKNSIAITDEEESSDRPQNKDLETIEEITQEIVETKETAIGDIDAIPPPPLPLSLPPSQVVIFALKDNENNDSAISTIENEKCEPEIPTKSIEEIVEEQITESSTEIIIPIKNVEVEDSNDEPTKVKIVESIIEELTEPMKPMITEEIEIVEKMSPIHVASINENNKEEEEKEKEIEIMIENENENEYENENEEQKQQPPMCVMDDFAAEALIIVDQIQKDLEKEDDGSQLPTESDSDRSFNGNDIDVETTESLSNIIDTNTQDVEEAHVVISSTITNTEQLIDEEVVSNVEENIEDIKETVTTTIISTISNSETFDTQDDDLVDLDSALSKLSISNEKSLHEIENQIESKQIQLSKLLNEDEEQFDSNPENDNETIQRNDDLIEIIAPAESESELIKKDCKSELIEPITYSNDIIAEDKQTTTTTTMMMMISDDKNDEFIMNSNNKEMPSAKELKENAAAAEITTQDLPVTCE